MLSYGTMSGGRELRLEERKIRLPNDWRNDLRRAGRSLWSVMR